MTDRTPATPAAALWLATFGPGLVLLLVGLRQEGTLGTALVVGAAVCFTAAVASVAAALRGRRAAVRA